MLLGGLLGLSGAIGAASMGLQHGFNLAAANRQYKYQRQLNLQQYDLQSQLNQQQQDFARENSLLDYNRTRELTQDSWKLNKLGMMQAGINPAFKDGSNAVANSNPTASPSAGSAQGGSAPTVQPVDAIRAIDNGVGNFLLAQKQSSEIELTKQQAENVRQDNLTKLQRDLADLAGKKANAKNDEERAQLSKLERVLKSRLFENEYQALLAEINSRKTKATVDAKIYEDMQMQELTNKRAEYLQIVENTNLTKKERSKAAAEIREIDARIRKLDAETEGQKLENKFNSDTMSDRKESVRLDNASKRLQNDLDLFTQPDKLQEAFNRVTLQKLEMKRKEILNVPHTLAERWSREAQEAYNRIKSGHASWRDYKDYYLELARENISAFNDEVKDYAKIILGVLPGSSSGNANTTNNKNVVTYSPQNY